MFIKQYHRYLPGKGTLVESSLVLLLSTISAKGANINVTLNGSTAAGSGEEVGRIKLEGSKYGLLITPDLKALKPGLHGVHVHETPSCGPV